MIFDKQNMFSQEQGVTANAVSQNVIDCGLGDTGMSDYPTLAVIAAPYGGTGSLAIELQTCDLSTFGTGVKTLASFPVDNDSLKAGGQIVVVGVPRGAKRYLRLNYVVTGTISGGKVTSGLVFDA